MKKKFVTLFPRAENISLAKDVGLIPNFMAKTAGYDSELVCFKNCREYDLLATESTHLNITFLRRGIDLKFINSSVIKYLIKESTGIDVLNLYHLRKETLYYGLLFKLLHPKGKLYLKMDVRNEQLEHGITYSNKKIVEAIHKYFESLLFKYINLISTENPESLRLLRENYPSITQKSILLPNGVNSDFIDQCISKRNTYDQKENIILSVGRVGCKIKNYEMLINAIINLDIKDWKVVIIGEVLEEFKIWYNGILLKHPHLKEKITFTGEILDRKLLYQYYDRAKLFTLTSRTESFGIVLVEAMYFSNYIVGTNGMSSFSYISNSNEFGESVNKDDPDELSRVLQYLIDTPDIIKNNHSPSHKYIKENFNWGPLIIKIKNFIDKGHS